MRIGLGHDVHRLVEGRTLVLGGVSINYHLGPDGHSDGDVVLHALTDGLLGAAGLGDIGELFPDTDPEWKDADSAQFVEAALSRIRERGWKIGNVDCTIFAERPKLKEVKPAIRRRVAEILEVSEDAVNIKAKTGEKVGPIGRGEAIAADAIVLLLPH
ncbi:MAG: 2-C-methyl-D-erythritol 2,4-cyclodiphosphate synthase [Planctomycetaceae bacterium]|nr:2-C-methyl-D-erythritol 2,4-cyclodiphosphate synthase [Planctomycetaceae bacterium]